MWVDCEQSLQVSNLNHLCNNTSLYINRFWVMYCWWMMADLCEKWSHASFFFPLRDDEIHSPCIALRSMCNWLDLKILHKCDHFITRSPTTTRPSIWIIRNLLIFFIGKNWSTNFAKLQILLYQLSESKVASCFL